MKNLVPAVASFLSGLLVMEKATTQPDWRIIPWTLMFAFWLIAWLLPEQSVYRGTIHHNTLPRIKNGSS